MITFARYQALFRTPGLRLFLLTSLLGRLPIGVATLAILLAVQAHAGSLTQAGVAAACYVLGLAAVAPLLGRLIDRLGPRPVLAAGAVAYPAALATFVTLLQAAAEPPAIAACAMIAGAALPPVSVAVRSMFPRLLSDVGLLQTAYSVDSALVELVFIVGPALVALLVAIGRADAAVLLAAVSGALGTALFIRCPAVRGWQRHASLVPRQPLGPLRLPVLRAVLATTVLYSIAFGLFEMAVTAFAARRGIPAVAGVILALASVGSGAGALWYGSRSWSPPLARQYRMALAAMAAGMLALSLISDIVAFALASIVSGAPMATVISAQSLLIARIASRDMLAESFTWGTTCLLVGVSTGIAVGGFMAESLPPAAILVAAGGATALAILVARSWVREDR